ncbi:hypothetical protein PSACC_02565 [Paramicrosporidium saccamoebae]|uniref:Uncharacterized protein n=1 Tax=Paramicrosporidium saccamoebae TaxID=1246581 RepID=A0A2H9TIP5_9FUNG|nr:hypothetical protein PSACC_02565 [Paramicrosporidium saccamoebae]
MSIFDNLRYDQETLEGLSTVLISNPSPHIQDAWCAAYLDKDASQLVFDSYIHRKEWHHLLLPLDLILSNKHLAELVDANWSMYRPAYYSLNHDYPIMSQVNWQRNIFKAIEQNPALIKGRLGEYGVSQGQLELWYVETYDVTLNSDIVAKWLEKLKIWLLVQLQAHLTDPQYSMENASSWFPYDARDRLIFHKFNSNPLKHYQTLLTRITILLGDMPESNVALWHGKLLYALLHLAETLPKQQIEEFLISYSPLNYQEATLLDLRPWFIKTGMFQTCPSSPLNSKMRQLGELHSTMLPTVRGDAKFLMFWNDVRGFARPLRPSSTPCTWLDICRLIARIPPDEILPPKFERPITIQSASSQPLQVYSDIYDLLRVLPSWLTEQSYVSTIFFDLTSESPLNRYVPIFQAIGRLLVWGIHYTGQDVFNFGPSVWDCLLYNWNYRVLDYTASENISAMLLCWMLMVPWQVSALRLHCKPRGLDFLLTNYTPLFQNLDYADDRTLDALSAIVTERLPAVAFHAYRMLSLSPGQCEALYRRFVGRPELHRWMLPLMLILNNPTLTKIVDWEGHRHDAFAIADNLAILNEEPWKTRIVKAVVDNPALLESSQLARVASMPSWLNPYHLYSTSSFREWLAKLPPLLLLVQMAASGVTWLFPHLIVPDSEDISSFNKFQGDLMDEDKFAIVLKRIMGHLETEQDSVKAIWHGKLVQLVLPPDNANHLPLSIILDYFNAYATEDYQFGMVQGLANSIILRQPLSESIPYHVRSKLDQLKIRFPSLQPFWGLRADYTRHWRRELISRGVFVPPLHVCDLQDSCLVLAKICVSALWLVHPTFANPFLIQHGEKVVSCKDVYCLLDLIPSLLVADGAIESTVNGAVLGSAQQSTVVWLTIGLLISWGFVYSDRDVFGFNDSQWQLVYDLASKPVNIEDGHEGLAVIVKNLMLQGFFRATRNHYIR